MLIMKKKNTEKLLISLFQCYVWLLIKLCQKVSSLKLIYTHTHTLSAYYYTSGASKQLKVIFVQQTHVKIQSKKIELKTNYSHRKKTLTPGLMLRKEKKTISDYPFISFTYKLQQIVKPKYLVIFTLFFVTIRIRFFKYAGVMFRHPTFRISSCSFCGDDGSAVHTLFLIIRTQFMISSQSGLSPGRSNTSISSSVSHSVAYRAL